MEEVSNILLIYFKVIVDRVVILVPILMELPLGFSYYIYICVLKWEDLKRGGRLGNE